MISETIKAAFFDKCCLKANGFNESQLTDMLSFEVLLKVNRLKRNIVIMSLNKPAMYKE